MRIRLIRKETIEDFARVNARSKPSFADNLGNSSHRVFNIGGNNYGMICKYHFGKSKFICSFAGSGPTRNMMNYGTRENNIR